MLNKQRSEMHNQFSQILATFGKSQAQTPKPKAPALAIINQSGTTTRDPPAQSYETLQLSIIQTKQSRRKGQKKMKLQPHKIPKTLNHLPSTTPLNHLVQIHVNLPFLEAMIHMPKGATILKDLLSHKDKMEKVDSLVKLSEECSAVIQRNLRQKEEDPGSFTLPCLIGPLLVKNTLADLGASINLMSHSLLLRLGISELKLTRMSIQLADQPVKYPIRVCENLLVTINKFIFSVDFVVLEMDEDELVPIILGQRFFATTRTVIDVHEGKLSLRLGNETITFNIGKSMRSAYSHDNYLYCADHITKLVQEQWVDRVIHDEKWTKTEEEPNPKEVRAVLFYLRQEQIDPLKWKALEN
ncbi:zf-CCHC domain-containing protein [Tanacetum coccineum]